MFKTASGVSDVSRLFKTTRLAQLQSSIGDSLLNANGAFPTQQIIESPAASFSRKDFGLKMRVPRKIKSRRIVLNDLDNQFGLPNFSTVNSIYHQKLKFREMALPVHAQYKSQLNDTSAKYSSYKERKNPLFSSVLQNLNSNSLADELGIAKLSPNSSEFKNTIEPVLKKLRKPFMKWLAVNHPEILSSSMSIERKSKTQYFIEFIKYIKLTNPSLVKFNSNEIPDSYSKKLSGTAGLSYNLSGRLIQTPNGSYTHRVQLGRVVSEGSLLAVNGFTSNLKTLVSSSKLKSVITRAQNESVDGVFSREVKIPLRVTDVKINLDSRDLNITSDAISAKRAIFDSKRTRKTDDSPDMSGLMEMLRG